MNKRKLVIRTLAIILGLVGLTIIAVTLYPIVSYEAMSKQKYPILLSPLAEDNETTIDDFDYTRASNWFVGGAKKEAFYIPKVANYTISIPTLGIENASVAIGGEDLAESLIQYPGTALPGKKGNAVIFGHSMLPRFYDPTNYLAIFSTLPTITKGEEIHINYDGLSFVYLVEDLFEVSPTDIQVLEQNTSDSFLTLVTCTPPGHPQKPKRLIVRARVIPPEKAHVNTRS